MISKHDQTRDSHNEKITTLELKVNITKENNLKMLTGTINKKEREYTGIFQRFGGTRNERYLKKHIGKPTMIRVINELMNYGVKGIQPTGATINFINSSIEKARTLGYKDGLLAQYKGEYIIVFLNIEGLDNCALKLTHNEEERKLLNEFYMSSIEETRLLLSVMCLNLLREKQRISMLNNDPTYGMIYSNYPDKDEYIDTFVRYINMNQAGKVANYSAIYAVNEALERGCSEEEILAILPRGIENKLFNIELTNYEIAQINALIPGISTRV